MDNTLLHKLHEEVKALQYQSPKEGKIVAGELYREAELRQNKKYMYEALFLQGFCHMYLNELHTSIDFLNKALQFSFLNFPNDFEKSYTLNNAIGSVYFQLDQQVVALHYFFEALKYSEIVGIGKGKAYHNIAAIYDLNKDYPKVLHYSNLCIAAAKREQDYISLPSSLLNSATVLARTEQIDEAKEKLKEAIFYLEKTSKESPSYDVLVTNTYVTSTEINLAANELDKACEDIEKALEEIKKRDNFYFYGLALYLKAKILLKKGEEKKSIEVVLESLEYAKKHALAREINDALHFLIDYYKEKKDWKNAFIYMDELSKITDKVVHKSKEESYRKIIRNRKKEISKIATKNHEIIEQNSILDQLSHILSHNISEPIQDILNFSELLEKKYGAKIDEDGKEFMRYIIQGANDMNMNFARLLEFTSLKQLNYEEIQSVNLQTLCKELQSKHEKRIAPFKIHFKVSSQYELQMVPSHAYTLFNELFSNAIRFKKRHEDCSIDMNVIKIRDHYSISFTDHGIGVESEYYEKVFRLFSRLDKDKGGVGIGLAICSRIIQLYGGDIDIESHFGHYTTIHFSIPMKFTS